MRDLEKLIDAWRIMAAPRVDHETLDELENHLRENVEQLVGSGMAEPEAFQRAVAELGGARVIASEFEKLAQGTWPPIKFVRGLGITAALAFGTLAMMRFIAGQSSLLLAGHAFTVGLGYTMTFLIGALGICFVGQRCLASFSPQRLRCLPRITFILGCIAACLTGVGIVLGMIWAKAEWGRYWGWDVKEVGAFTVIIWQLGFLFAHRFTQGSARFVLILSILGNVVVGLGWFGTNLIRVGLQSYEPRNYALLLLGAVIFNVVFFFIGLAPAGWLRLRKVAAFIVLLIAMPAFGRGEETDPFHEFDEFVTAAMKEWNVPGVAIAIVQSNRVVIAKGYGFRDIERKLPVTSNTLFAIGSTTKAFTTFLMGTLVDEGKLAWDKPVREFLPDFRLSDPRTAEWITPRDLVTHRSGIPRHDLVWYNNTTSTRRDVVQRLAHLEATETLRAKFQYNNLMYLAAGYLIEHVTRKSWEENVRERILRPLDMTNSNFSVSESTNTADFALPYEEKEERVRAIAFRNIDLIGPAGSINSSVAEMARWLRVNLNEGKLGSRRLIQRSTLAHIHSPQMPTGVSAERPEISQPIYTLGWAIESYRGHRRLLHGGGIDGFISHVTFLPDDQLGVVVFANLNKTSLPSVLANHAIDRALDMKTIDWNAEALVRRKKGQESQKEAKATKQSLRKMGTKPSHQSKDYAGIYEHPGYGELGITFHNNQFVGVFNAMRIPLEHWHYDVFNAMENSTEEILANKKFNFATDVNGNIFSVSMEPDGGAKEIIFKKKVDPRLSDTNYLARFVGQYELSGQLMNVSLKGGDLRLDIPGEREYRLVPNLDGGFTLKEQSQFSLKFATNEEDKVTAALLHRPEGVVTAKRKN